MEPIPLTDDLIERFCERSSTLYLRLARDGTIRYASATAARQQGTPREQLVGRGFHELCELARVPQWPDSGEEEPAPIVQHCRIPSGQGVRVSWLLRPCDDDEAAASVEAWGRVVEESPEPERRPPVSLAQQLAYGLLTSSALGVLVVGRSREIRMANPKVTLITGYPAEQLRQPPGWLSRLVPDANQREQFEETIRRGLERDGGASTRLAVTTQAGELRHLVVHVLQLYGHSRQQAGQLVLLDEVRQPRPMGQLAQQILDQAPVGIATLDAEGLLTYANPAHRRILGEEPEIAHAGPVFEHPAWRASGLGSWLQGVLRQLPAGPPEGEAWTITAEIEGQRALNLQALPLSVGEVASGILLLAEDVTEQRSLEEQLRHALKMDAMGTMAGGIAHDYNNMLGAILGFATVLDESLPDWHPQSEDVRSILHIAREGTSLTRQLMRLGAHDHPEGHVQLNDVVRNTVRLLRRTIPESTLIQLELDEALPPVSGSSGQLEQCLLNLCLNARDAMPKGGTLTLSTRAVALQEGDVRGLLEARSGEHVLLTVRDSGCGIERSELKRIFDPFFTTKPHGTGLGLPMVYRTVRAHEGHLRIDSEPNVGTRVRIYIPASPGAVQAQTTEASTPQPLPRGDETILLVDDAAFIRRSTQRLLSHHGYTVLEAGSGADAVELFRRHAGEIRLVILDLVMPQLGAPQVFQEMRAIASEPRVLLCSGYAREKLVEELIEQGAVGFLAKPFEGEELLRRVREAIDA